MKKLISLCLAFALAMSLSVTAFAEENVGAGAYSADVTGAYVAGTTSSGTVFSVDITWTDLSFTYHAAKAPVWDVNTHTYSQTEAAYWEGSGTITVTNHSNAKITATPAYQAKAGYETASMTFSTHVLKIASAESGAAQSGTITVTPAGSLPAMDAAETIGSITVTIAQDTSVTVEDAERLIVAVDTLCCEAYESGDMERYPDAYEKMNQERDELSDAIDAIEYAEAQGTLTDEMMHEFTYIYEDLLEAYNEFKALTGL